MYLKHFKQYEPSIILPKDLVDPTHPPAKITNYDYHSCRLDILNKKPFLYYNVARKFHSIRKNSRPIMPERWRQRRNFSSFSYSQVGDKNETRQKSEQRKKNVEFTPALLPSSTPSIY